MPNPQDKPTMPDRLRSTFAAWGLKTLGDEAAEEIERLRDALDHIVAMPILSDRTPMQQRSDSRVLTTVNDQVRLMRLARLDGIRWTLGDVSKHDLEMLADNQGGERAAPGPNPTSPDFVVNEEMS